MLGKTENRGGSISQSWETTKTRKNTFPKVGKTEKQRKLRFPILGKLKNSGNCISQHWENQKLLKTTFPNIGKAIFL